MILRRSNGLDLDGAVVVLTGASSGIGRATARRLACRGASLVLAARNVEALEETRRQCLDAGASSAVVGPTDVSDPEAVAALARRADEQFGRIDGWVNNAGVMAYGRFDEVPMEMHRQVIETNLLGAMYGAAESLPRFRRAGRGVLVNVASLYAEMTTPFVSSYVTSKFGLLGFSRVLQRDLRPSDGISVCCILPSSIDTPVFRHAANHHGRKPRAIPPAADPDRVARAIERCLERPRKEVRVGWFGRFAAQAEKLLPPVYDRVVYRVMRLVGFSGEDVEPHDGNVFEPVDWWQQVDGEWRNTGVRRAGLAAAVGAVTAGAALQRRRAA